MPSRQADAKYGISKTENFKLTKAGEFRSHASLEDLKTLPGYPTILVKFLILFNVVIKGLLAAPAFYLELDVGSRR